MAAAQPVGHAVLVAVESHILLVQASLHAEVPGQVADTAVRSEEVVGSSAVAYRRLEEVGSVGLVAPVEEDSVALARGTRSGLVGL